ncbi:hypothetical protein B5K06_29775 [Rhizobium grahamii]|uniref:Uncharacterized protein n=2 Tax=Rhizobium grahamii TaxID=1120045 RepID=A0A370KG27_9HYPH|nr:hypothetical protein B5K06_29775 [Rhizobium grahamii]
MGWGRLRCKAPHQAVRNQTEHLNTLKRLATNRHMRNPSRTIVMVSRIRRTLTVQERAAAFEHTNKVAADAAGEECRAREEKTERLKTLRLAEDKNASR